MALHVSIKKKLTYFDIDISFSCPESNMIAIIGPSGSGKTTIMRIIAGLESPDEGQIIYDHEVWFDSSKRINIPPQKRGLGYVIQNYTIFPHLSIYDNVALAAKDKNEVNNLLELFSINQLRNRKPHMVSGGERQRCALCQALARRPRVLLLDEPFSALDIMTRQKISEELRLLKGKLSCPVCYVTHDIHEALSLADDVIQIVDGKIKQDWMQLMIRNAVTQNQLDDKIRESRLLQIMD